VSLVVAVLYGAACLSPAIDYKPPENRDFGDITPYGVVSGFTTLLLGWFPPYVIPWAANLLLLVGWILLMYKKTTAALGFGVAAALLGLTTWAVLDDQMQVLVGYYLWQASLIAFALGALAVRLWQAVRARGGMGGRLVTGDPPV
jgi:hypothetical protein